MKRTGGWLAAVFFVAAMIGYLTRPSAERQTPVEMPAPSRAEADPKALLARDAGDSPTPSEKPAKPLRDKKQARDPRQVDLVKDGPRVEDYRAEVRENPHGVPPSLRVMANVMAGKMELALASEAEAKRLMPELGECAKKSPIPSLRRTCLVNARRLGGRYPSLTRDFETLRDEVSPEDRNALELLNPRPE